MHSRTPDASSEAPPFSVIGRLRANLARAGKWEKFAMIVVALAILGTLGSVATHLTLLKEDVGRRLKVIVVGPMTGPNAAIGQAMGRGATLLVDNLNAQGGIGGRKITLAEVDDADGSGQAEALAATAAADPMVVGVVGHWSAAAAKAGAAAYGRANLPFVSLYGDLQGQDGGYSVGLPVADQARFVANYARNVLQQRLMYVVREDSDLGSALADPFAETYQRFGTPIRQEWRVPAGDEAQIEASLVQLGQDLAQKVDIGAVYIAANPRLGARILRVIQESGSRLAVFGPDLMGTALFQSSLAALAPKGTDPAQWSNGVVVATPLLFDTANEDAQHFQAQYQARFGSSPDWIAAYAHDAVRVLVTQAGRSPDLARADGATLRTGVAEGLAALGRAADGVRGVTGTLWFDAHNRAQIPIQIGQYNGREMISAPIQLQPIAKGAVNNYIEELKQGRALYVNDRFMYKTNVVYVGVQLNEISDFDMKRETATLDFNIWFRYRGNVVPQDIVFTNAAETVVLDKPEQEILSDDGNYRSYRVKKAFFLNFTDAPRSYNHHVAGLSFRHRQLNRNNLLYVVDVLGMPSGESLARDLAERKVLNPNWGWEINRAWFAQEVIMAQAKGNPKYVGYSGVEPLYSRLELGLMLRPDGVAARDVIAQDFFIYIAIFGTLGVLFARLMDARRLVRYWHVQSWLLRVVFWPLLLLSAGNMLMDFAFQQFSLPTTRTIVLVYDCLWFIIPAWLVNMAVNRFVWDALQERSGRKIPNIIRIVMAMLLYALAAAGITAFVLNQTITSLLATSGVLAMIVGLAVKANIANVFSGIILNIERPFKVGDSVRIGNIQGVVKDITWRTTRIQAGDGQLVCLANGRVSEGEIQNLSVVPDGLQADWTIHAAPEIPPERIIAILREAAEAAPTIFGKDKPNLKPKVRCVGLECLFGRWAMAYSVVFRMPVGKKRGEVVDELAREVWSRFSAAGIPLIPTHDTQTPQEQKA